MLTEAAIQARWTTSGPEGERHHGVGIPVYPACPFTASTTRWTTRHRPERRGGGLEEEPRRGGGPLRVRWFDPSGKARGTPLLPGLFRQRLTNVFPFLGRMDWPCWALSFSFPPAPLPWAERPLIWPSFCSCWPWPPWRCGCSAGRAWTAPGCWPPCCPSGWPSSAPCCWTTSPPITRCSLPQRAAAFRDGAARGREAANRQP